MAEGKTLFDSVVGFAAALRRAGVPVSVGECLDAVRGLTLVDLLDRAAVRTSLCATLVKREEHLAVFDAAFARWFPAAPHGVESTAPGPATSTGSGPDLLAALPDALKEGDVAVLRAAAAMAVAQFGGFDREELSPARYHLFRVLRRLDLTRLLQQALSRTAMADGDAVARLRAHTAEFRRMIAEEVQALRARRLGDDEPWLSPLGVDDIDFLGASPTQLAAMREAVRPLARRLATRLARRRESQREGRVDMRRTARRSLSTGGVPIDPAFRRPRIHHPDLFVLCDLSGSVAEFAKFMITLLHALARELPRTRLFVFVDGVDEVTALVRELPETLDVAHLLTTTQAVGTDGHSDYGAALGRFWAQYGADVSNTSTVIIAGDARTNYRDPGTSTLHHLHERARRLYWLNPEPRQDWGTSDSHIEEYGNHCDQVVEVRNLRQLSDFVYRIG